MKLVWLHAMLKSKFLTVAFLSGCMSLPALTTFAAEDKTKHSPWKKVEDREFNACLEATAKKHKWYKAEDFLTIKCHSKGIKDVVGIEQFSRVKSISLYNNDLTQFPHASFPALTSLNLAKNKIAHFELENMPTLEVLYVFKNNLSALHLTNLQALSQLKANSNRIVDFQYSSLPKLEKVYLFDNAMEHIDIYSLPSMKYMDVRQNPMPDELYEEMDDMKGVTIWHDGNADDWS
ncbi:Internalin-A [Thalassocella blandensis]|nr:Internalin-A [Thalassocella blandensis]